jgi:hypothetical protein
MAEEFHFIVGNDGPVRVTRDEAAEQWPYRTKSAAWYAARQGHNVLCLDPEQWADKPELYAWLKEFVAIVEQPELLERYRQELLSPQELAAVRREEADIEKFGF